MDSEIPQRKPEKHRYSSRRRAGAAPDHSRGELQDSRRSTGSLPPDGVATSPSKESSLEKSAQVRVGLPSGRFSAEDVVQEKASNRPDIAATLAELDKSITLRTAYEKGEHLGGETKTHSVRKRPSEIEKGTGPHRDVQPRGESKSHTDSGWKVQHGSNDLEEHWGSTGHGDSNCVKPKGRQYDGGRRDTRSDRGHYAERRGGVRNADSTCGRSVQDSKRPREHGTYYDDDQYGGSKGYSSRQSSRYSGNEDIDRHNDDEKERKRRQREEEQARRKEVKERKREEREEKERRRQEREEKEKRKQEREEKERKRQEREEKERARKKQEELELQQKKQDEEVRQREEEERLERLKHEEEMREAEEAEKRRAAEEEESRQIELTLLEEYVKEVGERLTWRNDTRIQNLTAHSTPVDDDSFSRLDSSLKKNTAFIRKLKVLTEAQKESLERDFAGLNLTKYVDEAATALTEAKLKMSDVNCAVHVASLLHQRYSQFSTAFLDKWTRVLLSKKDDKISNPSKYRVDLRFFAELITGGVFGGKEPLQLLASQLSLILSQDKVDHSHVTIISSFVKYMGDDYAGLIPQKYLQLSEKHSIPVPRSTFLPAEKQRGCRNLLKEYYNSLSSHLLRDYKELRKVEKQNRKQVLNRGELSQDRKERYESLFASCEKLLGNTTTLADLVDEEVPELPKEEEGEDVEFYELLRGGDVECDAEGEKALFEDEDERAFYENLPNLRELVPGILYKDSEQLPETNLEGEADSDLMEDDIKLEDVEKELEDAASGADLDTVLEETTNDTKEEDAEDDTDVSGGTLKMAMDTFVQSLPNCVSKELIDRAALDFCMNLNTKFNRRKLAKKLFNVYRTRYDLLPFYARLVATLHPCMPGIAADLEQFLKNDLRWHVRKKDQLNIESKLKTVRFIGELVKFRMFAAKEGLHCLMLLLRDFSHHNIEMACAFLETSGRFLYRSRASHHKTRVLLDIMMRKREALHLDARYNTMIENAFYNSNPPDSPIQRGPTKPPMELYIEKLVYKDLSKVTTERVLRQMRKLDWNDPMIYDFALECLTGVWNVRYNHIHCVASVIAGLVVYHEELGIKVVDSVLEDIRIGMEINHPKFNQRRVSTTKLLGELYNYKIVDSSVIFKTLYGFITFGVSLDAEQPALLDPPEHLFRMRLVCVLLEICGRYFDVGISKKKLNFFLLYFQQYFLYKRFHPVWTEDGNPFPLEVSHMVKETIEMLRPKFRLSESFEEATKLVRELEKELYEKLVSAVPAVKSLEEDSSAENHGLATIKEGDEKDSVESTVDDLEADFEGIDQEVGGSSGLSQPRDFSPDDLDADEDDDISSEGSDREHAGSFEQQDHTIDADSDEQVGFLSSDDEEVHVRQGTRVVHCPEDDEFVAQFERMLSESIQARSQEITQAVSTEITVPVLAKPQIAGHDHPPDMPQEDRESTVNFVMMTKRGSKTQFAPIKVPENDRFAAKFKETSEVERIEKQEMKRMVLDMHERQEEEEVQQFVQSMSRQLPANLNRERKLKYVHPKGAPDADQIFGTKRK